MKYFTLIIVVILILGCGDSRNLELYEYDLVVKVGGGFEYVSKEAKEKYRKDLENWDNNGLLFQILFIYFSPKKPDPVKVGNDFYITCESINYPIKTGENLVKIKGHIGDKVYITDHRNSYEILSLGGEMRLNIELNNGRNILIYPIQ